MYPCNSSEPVTFENGARFFVLRQHAKGRWRGIVHDQRRILCIGICPLGLFGYRDDMNPGLTRPGLSKLAPVGAWTAGCSEAHVGTSLYS